MNEIDCSGNRIRSKQSASLIGRLKEEDRAHFLDEELETGGGVGAAPLLVRW